VRTELGERAGGPPSGARARAGGLAAGVRDRGRRAAEAVRVRGYELAVQGGAAVLGRLERLIADASLVGDAPFFDPGLFPWTAELEAAWQDIREELDAVLEHRDALPNFQDLSVDQATITDDDRWKTFFFFAYGYRADGNCARCPRTAALLERVPGLTTAFFSILGPRKHLGEHRGPYKGVLRYHLGLKVPGPEGACRIRVGTEVAAWREGASLVFDDTYPHEAWNDTDEDRVVLFADVVRPLRPPVSALNRALIRAIALSPFVQDGKRRHVEWERRFEAVLSTERRQAQARADGGGSGLGAGPSAQD
jgi:aspartyl/asparaginyl beta-hydroxylase (cupin superfamily)